MKVYSNIFYISSDETLIEQVLFLQENKQIIGKDKHMKLYQHICNNLRKSIDTENVLGFALSNDNTDVAIWEFGVTAEQGVYYDVHFNEERKEYYITVELGE